MQLVLELLKKIFVALQGVYTKQETDAAFATKADATALTAEAQAREEADADVEARVGIRLAEHDAEIETLQKVTAGLGEGATAAANVAKWQTYATAIQKDLDAETAMQLAQEFSRATDEYLADPTKTKDWSRTSVDVNNNPYAESSPSNILVDLSSVNASGYQDKYSRYPSFGAVELSVVFLPNAVSLKNAFNMKNISNIVLFVGENTEVAYALFRHLDDIRRKIYFAGKTTCANLLMLPFRYAEFVSYSVLRLDSLNGGFSIYYTMGATYATELSIEAPQAVSAKAIAARYSDYKVFRLVSGLPNVVDMDGFCCAQSGYSKENFKEIDFVGSDPCFPLAENASRAFENRNVYDQFIAFPSLHTGDDMFLNSGMSAANISAVLDSLPSDPVGKGGTGVITFTGCPGASELTQESESVVAATARGWTVEL